MKKMTILIIPASGHYTRQFAVPQYLIKVFYFLLFIGVGVFGFLGLEYYHLRQMKNSYYDISAQNQHLKGEAQILMNNLDRVNRSLMRIQDYTTKLDEIVQLKVNKVSKKTGIGPLSQEEYSLAEQPQNQEMKSKTHIPLGINIDHLIFRPVFDKLSHIEQQSNKQAFEMQHLLSTLSQKKSLLSSIPSITPVHGWTTSSYGTRISPFTGRKSTHKGVDIAAPVGTPIIAPADGVVIFSGAKAGFGNFIMIAHYDGIVTRYGHNAQNMVQAGQKVKRGDQIASVGMSGRTTGPHLHYELWVHGKTVNPRKFILDSTLDFLSN